MNKFVFIGDLHVYRTELQGKRVRQYKRLLEQAERYKYMELPEQHPQESTTYMGIAIVNLALAYLLSENEQYLKDAKRFMKAVSSYEKWGNAHLVNVDLSASWILFGLSLGYDWLKSYLTTEEQELIFNKIQHHAQIIYEYRRENYGSGWSTNFFQNHNWINMTGLATAGYVLKDESENSEKYIEEAKRNFNRVFSYLPEDGSNYEGVTYWRYGGMWLFVYAHLLKIQEGIDFFKSCDYLKNTFYYRLYQSCGDLKQQMNYGDCHDRYSGHTACVYYKVAAEYGDGYAQKLGNMVVDEFLMGEAANSKVKPGILPEAVFEFLWYDPTVEENELSELPLVRYFDDLGLLYIRNTWGRDAKVLTIKCGYPGGKKQWEIGWKINKDEGLDSFSLSHHHPDNLSYIFARGSEYFTCEDGYNRNIMPDNHNVILVDGSYTDAIDVNDVYKSSLKVRLEQEGDSFNLMNYGGHVSVMQHENNIVLYRGETSGIYPQEHKMQEVSRILLTDNLAFWIFVDIIRSEKEHINKIICNTGFEAKEDELGFVYEMKSGAIHYKVFSDKPIRAKQYSQQIESVMTTQEPDKVCRTNIQTLAFESCNKEKEQVFYECFTFDEEATEVNLEDGILNIKHGEKIYEIMVGECVSENVKTPVEIRVCDGTTTYYQV